jgi:hypothetical protein
MGLKLYYVTLREKYRLRMFENKVLKTILYPRRRKREEAGEECIMSKFITCTLHQMSLGKSNQGV